LPISVSGMTFENPTDNPVWPTSVRPFLLAGPWSGTRPQLAVTLRSDTGPWAKLGIRLCDVCSREKLFFQLRVLDKLFALVSVNTVCIILLIFEPGL
jgi:hypothetical protein